MSRDSGEKGNNMRGEILFQKILDFTGGGHVPLVPQFLSESL